MAQYIDKTAVVAEIKSKKEYAKYLGDNAINSSMQQFYDGMKEGCNNILQFIGTMKIVELYETWHLQVNDDIFDSFNDWDIHTFACLMNDDSIQKFVGLLSECHDGSINKHIDAIDDNYHVEDIVCWIEIPNLKNICKHDRAQHFNLEG